MCLSRVSTRSDASKNGFLSRRNASIFVFHVYMRVDVDLISYMEMFINDYILTECGLDPSVVLIVDWSFLEGEGAKLKATSENVSVGMEMVYLYRGAEN